MNYLLNQTILFKITAKFYTQSVNYYPFSTKPITIISFAEQQNIHLCHQTISLLLLIFFIHTHQL